MKWAIAQGYRADNPAGEAATVALPKQAGAKKHLRALPHGDVVDDATPPSGCEPRSNTKESTTTT